ncbi:hypothetical protein D9M71_440560 [compost metagenome]
MSYTGHRIEDHEPFIFDQFFPLVVGHVRTSNIRSEAAAIAAFLSLATALQAKGLSPCTLIACFDDARLPRHDAPEVLQ